MRCNPREVALSSASRDNSTYKLQSQMTRLCTLFLKLGSHYCREPPAPAGGGSTRYIVFPDVLVKKNFVIYYIFHPNEFNVDGMGYDF